MITRCILYLQAAEYSGYYTGKDYFLKSGAKYPGIVSTANAPSVKVYTSLEAAKVAGKNITSFTPSILVFDVKDKNNLSTLYSAIYNNGKLESEQKF